MADKTISRRSFLYGGVFSLALLGVGGGLKLSGEDTHFVRPPGIASEEDFMAKCIKCQKCLQVCHAKIITPVSLSESIYAHGTPRVDFKLGYCDFCMDCVEVCPTAALTHAGASADNIGLAVVVKDTCIAWDWSGCINCYLECPEKAITLDEHNRPIVHPDLCNGCGKCEEICPSASLRSYNNSAEKKGIIVTPREKGGELK